MYRNDEVKVKVKKVEKKGDSMDFFSFPLAYPRVQLRERPVVKRDAPTSGYR